MVKTKNIFGLLVFSIFGHSCVEEIELSTQTEFDSILVVEATITNELKTQRILLSRTSPLEEEFNPIPESDAVVAIRDNNNFLHSFQESDPGIYLSVNPFAATINLEYKLEISTNNGSMYSSSNMQLTQSTQIDNLYAERGLCKLPLNRTA